jgi:hypothetical protein
VALFWAVAALTYMRAPVASFVMGLVIPRTLSDYKDAARAPTDPAAGTYAILRETDASAAAQSDQQAFQLGRDRNDNDVSLFLLHEFVVHARLGTLNSPAGRSLKAPSLWRNTRNRLARRLRNKWA